MAANFWNITRIPETRKRLLYTALFLAVYRIGIFVSLPYVDRSQLSRAFAQWGGTLFGFVNLFSGGAFEQASIFSLGIMPYISASIVMQFLAIMVPAVGRLQKEGEAGRRRINQYTRMGTIGLALLQGFGTANVLARGFKDIAVVDNPSIGFFLMTMLTLTAGTTLVMWLGEQITEQGLGNGISVIIFSGIVSQFPAGVASTLRYLQSDMVEPLAVVLLLAIFLGTIACIVFFEQAQRRIPVVYAKKAAGGGVAVASANSHLPLKINSAGVMPPIFASSILVFPATIANFLPSNPMVKKLMSMQVDPWFYNLTYLLLIVFFCYFYTAVTFDPLDVADNMKKQGGYIFGIRPGKKTADYIDKVLSRITLGGAVYIATICILPTILAAGFDVPFRFGGQGLLIVVGVALDTVRQMESYLITHHYEGFAGERRTRIRTRRLAPV